MANHLIAVGAEQSPHCAGLVVVVNGQPALLRRVAANATDAALRRQHAVVILDPETELTFQV
jgi:hypothetical protein